MAEQATERLHVDGSPQKCFDVATDFERYPEWGRDIKEAKVVDRDEQGRGTAVAYRVAAMGRSARYTLAYDYTDAPRRLSWELVEGDIMRRLDGSYVFEPDRDGTLVTYHLAVDLIIPIPGFIKRRAEGKIIGTAIGELKRRVESL
jgi:ribosome-associated toxin RatA of RatAB toxin-antitoxin module